MTKISVVILVKDGMAFLPALIEAIRAQSLPAEIVAVDSGSRDGSAAFLAQQVDRFLTIDAQQFNHGATRNLGIAAASGELVVLLVQDALPTTSLWLEHLVAPLLRDPTVAGSFARQEPRAHASALTRFYLQSYAATSPHPTCTRLTPAELASLSPQDLFSRCTFDNVCSCVRKSVWQDLPFPEVAIAEDLAWAKGALVAGYGLSYAPHAVVAHSHERSAWYEFKRTYLVHEALHRFFGFRTITAPQQLLAAVTVSLSNHLLCLRAHTPSEVPRRTEVPRALCLAFALPLAQYFGARSLGRRLVPLGGV